MQLLTKDETGESIMIYFDGQDYDDLDIMWAHYTNPQREKEEIPDETLDKIKEKYYDGMMEAFENYKQARAELIGELHNEKI